MLQSIYMLQYVAINIIARSPFNSWRRLKFHGRYILTIHQFWAKTQDILISMVNGPSH